MTPSDTAVVQHAPAMKVGGRRLSLSTRHKSSSTTEPASPKAEGLKASDYPRPGDAPLTPTEDRDALQKQKEKEKKEDKEKDKHRDHEKHHMQEHAHWKAETTRPTRDMHGMGNKGHTIGVRIGQPAGKAFGV